MSWPWVLVAWNKKTPHSMRRLAMRFRGLLRGGAVEKLDGCLSDARRSGGTFARRWSSATHAFASSSVLKPRMVVLVDQNTNAPARLSDQVPYPARQQP